MNGPQKQGIAKMVYFGIAVLLIAIGLFQQCVGG